MSGAEKSDYTPVCTNGTGDFDSKNNVDMETENVELKRSMGLVSGVCIIVGCIIGSGIFVSPGGVLIGTGSINLALIVWVLCGMFSMIGAYCYAELGLCMRKSGGDYAYIHYTFGPFIGFMRLWAECLIVRPCTVAIVSLTFSKYITKPLFPECNPPDEAVRMLAAGCICKHLFYDIQVIVTYRLMKCPLFLRESVFFCYSLSKYVFSILFS